MKKQQNNFQQFNQSLMTWFDANGRKNLPWQNPRDPYRVWLSEIMLQQTQVKTVIPYFEKFVHHFPDIHALAAAALDDVLSHWSGLGYYSRARNLHKTAQIIQREWNGVFPDNVEQLKSLPGIGPSTAAAIASQAFEKQAAILDGNVMRVLSRHFAVEGITSNASVKNKLWSLAEACMPATRCADYTQAIMDLGALCCTRTKPTCGQCPLQLTCQANMSHTVHLYPQQKNKRALPLREQQFLLLQRQGLIYLEKRPPTGLWGGLWSLPAIDRDQSAEAFVADTYGLAVLALNPLTTLKHTFSHFHLLIHAVSLDVDMTKTVVKPLQIAEQTGNWFTLEQTKQLGMAKPVSQLILMCQLTTE